MAAGDGATAATDVRADVRAAGAGDAFAACAFAESDVELSMNTGSSVIVDRAAKGTPSFDPAIEARATMDALGVLGCSADSNPSFTTRPSAITDITVAEPVQKAFAARLGHLREAGAGGVGSASLTPRAALSIEIGAMLSTIGRTFWES